MPDTPALEGHLLAGKVAIVTGAGPGMGRSIALRFAHHGAAVVLGARRQDALDAVADDVRAAGGQCATVRCDITDRSACDAIAAAAVDAFGGLDIVVQNAHHEGDWTPAAEADLDSWRNIMEINFFGALQLVQASVPAMDARGGGAVLLVNSGAAVSFPPSMGAYSASKSALASLTRTLAKELAPQRIRVNGMFLGPVAGENLHRLGRDLAARAGQTFEEWERAKGAELPLGHIPTPDECAGAALFFCSQLSAPVTGQHLSVNGGQWVT